MGRISVWIAGDQLLEEHPALAHAQQEHELADIRLLLVESARRTARLPYQRKKLVLLFSAMRHYGESLRQQGYVVDYVRASTFGKAIRQHLSRHRPDAFLMMAASASGGRQAQAAWQDRLQVPVTVLPNTQFLVGRYNPYPEPDPDKRYVLEHFYRAMRRHFQVLMDGDEPAGGRWNFDRENRKPLPVDQSPPPPLTFAPEEVTTAVMEEVARMPQGVGSVDGFDYAVTRSQALAALRDFLERRLPHFGDYEDALTGRSHAVYHSLLSPYLNLGLLTPLEVVRAAEDAYRQGNAPINAAEGFVRQVLGWREFMYWQYWRQMPRLLDANAWSAQRPLPAFAWDGQTDMACLQHALRRAIDTGYNHHIERLMLLCNFFMLTGIAPRQVNDWFLAHYIDAYDWVMAPNVMGMGLNADGGLTATKPYIASANYIRRMGDFCQECAYDPRQRHGEGACPFNYLYWHFILQHEARLRANPRTSRSVLGLRHLDQAERQKVQREAEAFLAALIPRG